MQKWLMKHNPTCFMLPTSHYDIKKADIAVNFIQKYLTHTKGKWQGTPFLLLPWQEQIIRDIFGVIKSNGYRQFNTAFITTPKKAGKSELAAAVALYMLCADGESAAEVYGVANDRKQAEIVFNVASGMVGQSPFLSRYVKVTESHKKMTYRPTRSVYQAMSSEVVTKYGLNVSCCVFDELLGQNDRKLYDVMTKGSGMARSQPLNFVITTAGSDQKSICYAEYSKAKDILDGRKSDPTFYPVIFGADKDEDWTDPKTWRNAHPSIGVTVDEAVFESECENAKQDTAVEVQFRQFYLNQWTSSSMRWMPMDAWDKCKTPIDLEHLRGRTCFGGLDLSTTSDLSAFVLVFPPEYEDEKYEVLPYFWLPHKTCEERAKKDSKFAEWVKKGLIIETEGNVVDYNAMQDFIVGLGVKYNIKQIAYDDWNATATVLWLADKGFEMVNFGQGYRSMNPPTKELMRLIKSERLIHGGHEVLRWNADNLYVVHDSAGNEKPDKQHSSEKIDGIVALVMALGRAMNYKPEPTPYYVSNGLFFV
jgi:phage terminase large subunit-like protein